MTRLSLPASPLAAATGAALADAGRSQPKGLSLRRRRLIAAAVTVAAAVICGLIERRIDASLGHASVFSGSVLLACLLILMLLGLRRRLIVLPLGSAAAWTQVHLYTGIFAAFVFALHVPRIFADGLLEGGLAWLFLIVSGSGFYGLYASRTIPKRLTAMSSQPRYDRLDWHRNQVAEAADRAIESLHPTPAGEVLATYYRRELRDYFRSPMPRRFLLRPTAGRRGRLLTELSDLRRYLDAETSATADRLAGLIRSRDEFDYQHAMQFRLRAWVTVHASLSLVLLAWSLVHAVSVFVMRG